MIIAGDRAELFVDGARNALIQSVVQMNGSTVAATRAQPLVAKRPIFLGGAPTQLLVSAQSAAHIRQTDGLIGECFTK